MQKLNGIQRNFLNIVCRELYRIWFISCSFTTSVLVSFFSESVSTFLLQVPTVFSIQVAYLMSSFLFKCPLRLSSLSSVTYRFLISSSPQFCISYSIKTVVNEKLYFTYTTFSCFPSFWPLQQNSNVLTLVMNVLLFLFLSLSQFPNIV